MKILDAGHVYSLETYDDRIDQAMTQTIQFMKRYGEGFFHLITILTLEPTVKRFYGF